MQKGAKEGAGWNANPTGSGRSLLEPTRSLKAGRLAGLSSRHIMQRNYLVMAYQLAARRPVAGFSQFAKGRMQVHRQTDVYR